MYWWVSLIVALFFGGVNVAIFIPLRGKVKLCQKIVTIVCAVLLAYKIGYYTFYQIMGAGWNKFPVEYSAVTYFVFTLIVLTKREKLMPFGIFSAILSGLMYCISFIVAPAQFVPPHNSIYELITACINHNALYFCGMLLLLYVKPLNKKLWWEIPVGVGVFAAYAALLKHTVLVGLNVETIIYEVSSGDIIARFVSALIGKWYYYIWYYPVLILLISVLSIAFFKLNTAKKYAPKLTDLYVFPDFESDKTVCAESTAIESNAIESNCAEDAVSAVKNN